MTVMWIALASQRGAAAHVGVVLAVALGVVTCVRAFVVRERLLDGASSQAEEGVPVAVTGADADVDWTPAFPAQRLREEGRTWANALTCNGHDRHELSMSIRQAAACGVGGATLLAVDLLLHIYGRGIGAGIGLLLFPLFAVLFARWVDGPVLYYRSWGRLHELSLTRVTSVTAAKPAAGRRALLLSAPGLAKPLQITLQARGTRCRPRRETTSAVG
jgi:hypothetical protein